MSYDRVILELLDRVSALEEEVRALKESRGDAAAPDDDLEAHRVSVSGKDTTKYLFDGRRYGKNRLVLAVIQKYMEAHGDCSATELMDVFDKSLQGSLGVVRTLNDARRSYHDSDRRFFMRPEEIIRTTTDDCVVCTQWGAFNIDYFIARAQELGFEILKV